MQPPAHFLAGAAAARYVRWRPLGLVLAIGTHFVLDAIPHFEDPSILPAWLSPAASRHWLLILAGTHVAALVLVAAAWVRLLAAWRSDRRRVLYVVGAGVLSCLPDYISRLWDPCGVVGYLNTQAHRWWFEPYLRAVLDNPASRPTIAFGCIAAELVVCVICALLLFRGLRPNDKPPATIE